MARIIDSAPAELDIVMVTRDRDLGARTAYPGLSGSQVRRNAATVAYLNVWSIVHWVRLIGRLRRKPIAILYVNSPWDPWFSVLPVVFGVLHILPVRHTLIAARGSFSPSALGLKARKKRWFLMLWRPLLSRIAASWHASTDREAEEIRAVFPDADILVCPQEGPPLSPAVQNRNEPGRGFVFIGRIGRMKNLLLVLQALREVAVPLCLDIYGPLEDHGYWAECRDAIDQLPLHIVVSYRGELTPDDVVATFAAYDAFVFPTLGENFGHVVAESLSAGCPVICSDQTPWTATLNVGGGEVVNESTTVCWATVLSRWAARADTEVDDARLAAIAAYRGWQAKQPTENVLVQALDRVAGMVPRTAGSD